MVKQKIAELLGEWEGYSVGTIGRRDLGGQQEVWIELLPRRDHPRRCGGCGQASLSIHDTEERWVKDLPILDCPTYLLVHRVRVACSRCGAKLEELPWLEPYARVTVRLAQNVARLCKVTSVKHAAEFYGLNWKTAKKIDKAYLLKELGPVDLSGVEQIALDEFAIHKGHRYATVIIDPNVRRVLWVGRGHGREDIRPFFELLGEEGRKRIKAVAMDMNGAYEAEVNAQCPEAAIVYDLFHVVAKYGREVVDRVRTAELHRLRQQEKARRVIKNSRWLLLRNRQNLPRAERVKLTELLAANRKLMTVYVLKDDLKSLWDYRSPTWAWKFWLQWNERAVRSRIKPLMLFAQRLKTYLRGILSHCRWPLSTSVLEGINNKIKVIKRVAYGFRDDEYFFLKILRSIPRRWVMNLPIGVASKVR